MQSSPVCPKCGCLMPGGACPMCGAAGKPSMLNSNAPAGSRSLTVFWLALGCCVMIALVLCGSVSILLRRVALRRHAAVAALRHVGPVARLDELKGSGRIYLVRLGEAKAPYSLDDFAAWLRGKYGLDVQVLPGAAADRAGWDRGRRQFVAERLYDQLKRDHPDLAANPNAYLIGFTDASMYSVQNDWGSSFTQRYRGHMAVISAHGMEDRWPDRGSDAGVANQHLQARLRRILLKDVAVLYWHLPVNNDPTSLLHDTLDPDLPADEIYESDLEPERSKWGRAESEPCVYFSYTAAEGMKPLPGDLIRGCGDKDLPEHEEGRELIQVDLRLGLLVEKHTDFELPDSVPIEFQRAMQQGWKGAFPFGTSGTDNYDQYLASDDNVTIRVIHNDGGRDELVRVPRWLGILPLVKYVDTDSGRFYEMRWYRQPFEHYDVRRYDGEVRTYLPCEGQQYCYLIGYRNAEGQALTFERDESRRLMRLSSPNRSWLQLTYGPANRIAEIVDSRGRDVRYGYDARNRLTSVSYPSGEVFHYEYDDERHLLAVSVSPDANAAAQVLVRNEYMDGKVIRQTFANGEVYSYSYFPDADGQIQVAMVHAPGGKVLRVDITGDGSIVRERDAAPVNAARLAASEQQ